MKVDLTRTQIAALLEAAEFYEQKFGPAEEGSSFQPTLEALDHAGIKLRTVYDGQRI